MDFVYDALIRVIWDGNTHSLENLKVKQTLTAQNHGVGLL